MPTEPMEASPRTVLAGYVAALERVHAEPPTPRASRSEPRKPARRGPGRPADADSTQTRARILAAARTCFARHGYDRTTNKDIAEEADFSAGTIYHYFSSKPALFVAVANEVQRTFFARYMDELRADGSLADCLVRLIDVMRDVAEEDPTITAFMSIWAVEYGRHEAIRAVSSGSGLEQSIRLYEQLTATTAPGAPIAGGGRGVAAAAICMLFGLSVLVQISERDDLSAAAAAALADVLGTSSALDG